MDKSIFFQKFNYALRWFLPPDEAKEVYADYLEMQQQADQNGESFLVQEDKPWQLARSLQNKQEYRKWLLIFALLLLCPLVPAFYFLDHVIQWFSNYTTPTALTKFLFWLSLPLALFWAHRCKRQFPDCQRPTGLLIICALFIAGNALAGGLACYWLYEGTQGSAMWLTGRMIFNYMLFLATISALFSLLGLVFCRLLSSHWLAVYTLSVTMLFGIMIYMGVITSMDIVPDQLTNLAAELHSYFLPLFCGLAASLKILF